MKNGILLNIGFDDIDTPYGGCTTHYASLLLFKWLREKSIKLNDYPNLIRLNPGIPWKTRGNGCVVLRILVNDASEAYDLFEYAIAYLEEYLSEYSSGWRTYSQPSIIAYLGEPDNTIKWFSSKALYDVIPVDLLHRILRKIGNKTWFWPKEIKRGLIGGLAGIGYRMTDTDYTYELIAYRSPEQIGSKRRVDPKSVVKMDKLYSDETILNYDYEENRPLITPHGPDPILLGIRGEKPDTLIKAYRVLEIDEPVPLAMIYRTNQHTDAHLHSITSLKEAYSYRSVRVRAWVSKKPRRIIGGHVVFTVTDGVNEVDAIAYQPTGRFRDMVEQLEVGDEVEVMGVVRPPSPHHRATINLEKIHVIAVKPKIILENPRCPKCGARMKSMGRGKGFKCIKCGFRDKNISKIRRIVERSLKPGWYEPPPRAFKHLMKPIKRFGKEKKSFPSRFSPKNFLLVNNKLVY